MKKFYLTILCLVSVTSFAQQQRYLTDLDFLYNAILQMPSYKAQLKNDKDYAAIYDELKDELNDTTALAVYKKLYRLIEPLKDNHLRLYKVIDTTLNPRPIVLQINTDSLRLALKEKPIDALAGIYKVGDNEFAVFENIGSEYYILHLKSKIVTGFLIKTPQQSLDFISLTGSNRGAVLVRNVKHINGNFTTINLYKTEKPIYGDLKVGESNFEFKKLTDEVDYLRLSNFSTKNNNMAASELFFNDVKDSITAPNLIVDIRNNGGGAFKTSQRYIKFIKKFSGKVFILQNVKTASNAEKFLIRLNTVKHVTTLGETTIGTLAYGSNYGKTLTLPNSKIQFYPTDMKAAQQDLAYESIGVAPMIVLDYFSEDWILQTLQYIENISKK